MRSLSLRLFFDDGIHPMHAFISDDRYGLTGSSSGTQLHTGRISETVALPNAYGKPSHGSSDTSWENGADRLQPV